MNVNFRMVAALTPAATPQGDTRATALLLCCSAQTTSPAVVSLPAHSSNNVYFRPFIDLPCSVTPKRTSLPEQILNRAS